MGQQQLLLIALGVIVVGVMIVTGMGIFNAYSESTSRDQLVQTLNSLGMIAYEYYKKPAALGGGGGDFSGWKLPDNFKKYEEGKISASVNRNRVRLNGRGTVTGKNGETVIQIIATVNSGGVTIQMKN